MNSDTKLEEHCKTTPVGCDTVYDNRHNRIRKSNNIDHRGRGQCLVSTTDQ